MTNFGEALHGIGRGLGGNCSFKNIPLDHLSK